MSRNQHLSLGGRGGRVNLSPCPCPPLPETSGGFAGEFGGRVSDPAGPPTEALVLGTLRQLGAARVYDLTEELGTSPLLVEGLLRELRRRGLVSCAEEGSPPVFTWRPAGGAP